MAKIKNVVQLLWGILIGNILTFFILSRYTSTLKNVCLTPNTAESKMKEMDNDHSTHQTGLIMVGVMTAPKYFDSRANAVYNTWGREIPGEIKFYSSEGTHNAKIPLIALTDVDDSYPPQKKSLMMLKHMHDNYLDKYEWFMRADDDVYIRPDRLGELLRSVDSKKMWFIGQTGRGNSEEFGLLSLDSDENFCMGGPGIIFSRETLKRVAPFVDDCLKHLYTTHEDVELGRCVRRFAGVSCTWSYQMQVIFYHNQSGHSAFTGGLKQREIHQAITLHPIKHSEDLYRLHKYFKSLKIQDIKYVSNKLKKDLEISRMSLHGNYILSPMSRKDNEIINYDAVGRIDVVKSGTIDLMDINEWDFLSGSFYSSSDLNPRRRLGSSFKEGLTDVIIEVMELINHYSKQRGRLIEFKEILYCYWKLHPIYGVEYILDLLLVYRKYRGHKMTIQVRRHAYVQQSFTDPYIREIKTNFGDENGSNKSFSVPFRIKSALLNLHKNLQPLFDYKTKNKEEIIHFILPLSGRLEIFERFIKNYEEVCLIPQEATDLNIILYDESSTSMSLLRVKELVTELQKKYSGSKMTIFDKHEKFSRGRALHYGINHLNDQDLIFFIDVDMVFTKATLTRTRLNTSLNKSIYFPIVYSLYNPNISSYSLQRNWTDTEVIIEAENGFWRQFGFGIVSLYKSDYLRVGGINLLIIGWGFEDVTFYDKVIKSSLKIVRCVDPSLIHVYHVINCDENLDNTQKNMCLGTKASALGSLKTLQEIYYGFQHRLENNVLK